MYFWGKFGPIISSSTKWLKFRRGVQCCMLITILMFTFSKFLTVIFFWENLISKSEVLQINSLIYSHYDFNVYFFKNFVVHIILDKTSCCPSWPESIICVHYQYNMSIIIESCNFSKTCSSNIMGKFHFILFSSYWQNYVEYLSQISVKIESNRLWDEIFPKNLWMANTSKNYTSKG